MASTRQDAASFVMTAHGGAKSETRRSLLRAAGLVALGVCAAGGPAYALKPGKPSKEKMLNRNRAARTPEEIAADNDRRAAEREARLERQRELTAAAEQRRLAGGDDDAPQADKEANLRANYYFPTARKRYLPRVRRALELLPGVGAAAASGDWARVSTAAAKDGPLDEAVLPMRLYASSLAGQGLSLAAKFVQSMSDDAGAYEKALGRLRKAARRGDGPDAEGAVAEMTNCIGRYRRAGKLEADDFGVGEVPSDTRVGSGLGNNNPALYKRNFQSILTEPQ